MSIQTPVMNKPCGCRGACDCSKDICSPCGNGSFVRPRFFAGQLLTEEDLQALVNYTVEKQRLHNRYLHGAGVVCGLAVIPHPCEDQTRKVIVQPGYAIDCCGDDIVVPCEEELDILNMVDELRRKLLGRDCRDPCAENNNGKNGDAKHPDNPYKNETHTYYLYINYCEQPTEYVAPYAFDEPCSDNRCEHSRIHESYSFELRCPPTEDSKFGLFESLRACRSKIRHYQKMAARSVHALATLEAGARVTHKAQTLVSELQTSPVKVSELEGANERLQAAIKDQEQELELADAVNNVLAVTFRALFVEPNATPNESVLPVARRVQLTLSKLLPECKGERIQKDVANLLIQRNDELERILTAKKGESATSFDGWARITGELLTKKMVHDALLELEGFKDDLLNLSATGNVSIGPELRPLLARVSLRRFVEDNVLDRAVLIPLHDQPSPVRQQAEIVGRAVAEVEKRCLCDAFLPPCPECDDPAVLLASVKVKDCKVVDVCNLHRQTVISGPALNYWFSGFTPLLDLLRRACCPTSKDEYKAQAALTHTKKDLRDLWQEKPEEIASLSPATLSVAAWNKLQKAEITEDQRGEITEDERGRFTAVPPPPSILDMDETLVPAEQTLNLVLAGMAGRPAADFRPIIDVVGRFGRGKVPTPSLSKRLARLIASEDVSGVEAMSDESRPESVTPDPLFAGFETLIDQRVAAAVAKAVRELPESSATLDDRTAAKKTARKRTARKKNTKKKTTPKKTSTKKTTKRKKARRTS